MAALMTGLSELEISETEGRELNNAIVELQRHYPVALDPKIMAWMQLLGVCGVIYAPRVMMIRERKKQSDVTDRGGTEPEPSTDPDAAGGLPPVPG